MRHEERKSITFSISAFATCKQNFLLFCGMKQKEEQNTHTHGDMYATAGNMCWHYCTHFPLFCSFLNSIKPCLYPSLMHFALLRLSAGGDGHGMVACLILGWTGGPKTLKNVYPLGRKNVVILIS